MRLSGSCPVDRLTETEVRREIHELEATAQRGELTSAQARRLNELRAALAAIEHAKHRRYRW